MDSTAKQYKHRTMEEQYRTSLEFEHYRVGFKTINASPLSPDQLSFFDDNPMLALADRVISPRGNMSFLTQGRALRPVGYCIYETYDAFCIYDTYDTLREAHLSAVFTTTYDKLSLYLRRLTTSSHYIYNSRGN